MINICLRILHTPIYCGGWGHFGWQIKLSQTIAMMGKPEFHHEDVRWELKTIMGWVVCWRFAMINFDGSWLKKALLTSDTVQWYSWIILIDVHWDLCYLVLMLSIMIGDACWLAMNNHQTAMKYEKSIINEQCQPHMNKPWLMKYENRLLQQ